MRLHTILALAVVGGHCAAAPAADAVPYTVSVSEAKCQPAPALHSFAVAVHDGKWLLIGGRTNGFHRTSNPESTFPSKFSNEYIHVVDPARNAAWKVGIPEKFRLALRTTNMEFYQDGDILYLVGGYGSKSNADAEGDYQTFPNLTAVRVPQVIAAITSGKHDQVESAITSIEDERMRVTGGGLQKLGDTFYLVFGQNYDKKYKGAVTGKYTNEIRRFKIRLGADSLAIRDYEAITDPKGPGPDSQFHRRDLNVVPAIRPDGTPGISAYGGVFTRTGSAWVNPVLIDQDALGKATAVVDTKFQQKMCQYDAARACCSTPRRRPCTRRFSAASRSSTTTRTGTSKRAI